MSLIENGRLGKWNRFQKKGYKVFRGINKERTILKLIPMLHEHVLDGINGDESKLMQICLLGPKRLWKQGALSSNGWRRGFTLSPKKKR